jgi:hypothetical protein
MTKKKVNDIPLIAVKAIHVEKEHAVGLAVAAIVKLMFASPRS